jgi:hypothetical protein
VTIQGPGKVGIRPRLSVDHGVAQRHATALVKPDARFPLQACSGILVQTATCRGPGSGNDAFEGVEEQDEDPEGEPEGDQIDPARERGAAQSRERAPKEADEGEEVEER